MEASDLTPKQRVAITAAVELAREISGRCFAVYVGPLDQGRDSAIAKHALIPGAQTSVLIAVDPVARTIDIVTGTQAAIDIDDRSCELAVLAMRSNFEADDLVGGIRAGAMLLAEHARAPRVLHLNEPA
jgi:hypothetical protein